MKILSKPSVITIDNSGFIPPAYLPEFGTGDWSIEMFLDGAPETEHDKVVRILKGDFEKRFGMKFERFIEVYHEIVKDHPERLI